MEAKVSAKISSCQDSPQAVIETIDKREVEEFCTLIWLPFPIRLTKYQKGHFPGGK
jgi:hypothetical protein